MPTSKQWSEPVVLALMERGRGKDPIQLVERHADQLRSAAEQHELPVDVDLIASFHGVKAHRRPSEFAGRIYADERGQLVMDLNSSDNRNRQRFTCAHELIHLAFPGFRKEARYRMDVQAAGANSPNSEEEYLCDLGAASLLMPLETLGPYSLEDGLQAVESLSEDAAVSLEAAGNRLAALSDRPAAFLVFAFGHKPADRPALRRGEQVPMRLRLSYATTGRLEAYLPRFKSVDVDSVFGRALTGIGAARGVEALPGAAKHGAFAIEAKSYGAGDLERVLAVAVAAP